jgi:hypothetical protein
MNEQILAPVLRGDEAVPFLGVEPLYRSKRHIIPTFYPMLPTDFAVC